MTYTYEELINWNLLHEVYPTTHPDGGPSDFHRAQIERWLWDNMDRMVPPVIDIGAEWVRGHLQDATRHAVRRRTPPRSSKLAYHTLNNTTYDTAYTSVRPDIVGSVTSMPLQNESVGTVVCTEVLEHVFNIFRAVAEIRRVIEPGGWVFIATPFMWPTHDNENYGDYWRITEQGYRAFFHDFQSVQVTPIELRPDSKTLWSMITEMEVMGNTWQQTAPTGYCVAARK